MFSTHGRNEIDLATRDRSTSAVGVGVKAPSAERATAVKEGKVKLQALAGKNVAALVRDIKRVPACGFDRQLQGGEIGTADVGSGSRC